MDEGSLTNLEFKSEKVIFRFTYLRFFSYSGYTNWLILILINKSQSGNEII